MSKNGYFDFGIDKNWTQLEYAICEINEKPMLIKRVTPGGTGKPLSTTYCTEITGNPDCSKLIAGLKAEKLPEHDDTKWGKIGGDRLCVWC